MSLINRMLRDLSTRQPESGNVMSGIQVRALERRNRPGRVVALVLLAGVAVFGALFWKLSPVRVPPPAAPVASVSGAGQAAVRGHAAERFHFDPTMSPPVGGPMPLKASAAHHRDKPAGLALDPQASMPSGKPRSDAPHDVNPRDQREAQVRFAEASAALKRGEPSSAERALRETLELDPSLHEARATLIGMLLDQNRLQEAQAMLDDGFSLEPQRTAYRRLAARLDLVRGQPEAARARLESSPPPVAADPEYHGLLAAAYQRLNRNQDAAREYQALIQAQPSESHWWAGLGISRDALGDVAGALSAYSQARALGNLDARLLDHINKRSAALQQPAG